MSEISQDKTLVAICPHCRKSYMVRPEMVGRVAKCRQCTQPFTLTPEQPSAVHAVAEVAPAHGGSPAAAAAPVVALTAPAAPATTTDGLLCPICQCAVEPGEVVSVCPVCQSRHHKDCWDYNRGCGLYGCKEAPETEKLQDIETPASFWGQTEKACPNCQHTIQAAAVRCRHCGATFESAQPQASGEFHSARRQKQALPVHQRIGIIVLVCAVIPFTAPFAAIFGLIWYFTSRDRIAAMPALQATICRLGVAVAIVVTAIMIVIAALYAAFG